MLKQIKNTSIILLILLLLIHYDFIYKFIISHILILIWFCKNKDFKKYLQIVLKYNFQQYIDNLIPNKIHYFKVPLFDNVYISKLEELDYTDYNKYNKKNL